MLVGAELIGADVVLRHGLTVADGCLARNEWVCGDYLTTRRPELLEALAEHARLTAMAVGLAFVVAVPLALLARRSRLLRSLVLGGSTAVYTVPSLALFSLLLPVTGLTATTVVVGLVLYSLTVLVRAVLTGVDGVPGDVVDAARGIGYGPWRLWWTVEFPLALPAVVAGLRVATVSAVALTTVGAIVGHGGLGDLLYAGLRSNFRAEVLTATVGCVALALLADLLLLGLQRRLTPWRSRRAS